MTNTDSLRPSTDPTTPKAPPTRLEVALLQQPTDYPAVSLLCPAGRDPRSLRLQLDGLARTARRRLVDEYGPAAPIVDLVMAALAAQIEELDAGDLPSVGVFVSPGQARWYPISEPVEARVVIDDTFATRDLVHAQLRSAHSHVLHLNDRTTRLYAGAGHRFAEVLGGGFPLTRPAPAPELDDGHRPLGREPSRVREQELRRFVREVDDALEPVLRADPLPLIVVGPSRRLAAFGAASRHRRAIDVQVPWGGRHLAVPRLDDLVGPAIEQIIERDTAAALDEVDAAIGAQRLVQGLDACWTAGWQHRIGLLVVEHGFSEAARLDPDTGTIELTDEREAPDVIDDLVDELIEGVLARRGRVTIVADGTLADRGRVVACTRG